MPAQEHSTPQRINAPSHTKRIIFLDYLRIFAFLSVLASHKFYAPLEKLAEDPLTSPVTRLATHVILPCIKSGVAGVAVFFLVSGYIITNMLQTGSTRDFLIKRFFRIYPLYFTTLLLEYILCVASHNTASLQVFLAQLGFVGDFFGAPYALNSVEWTLRIEVMFYIFMAVLHYFNFMATYRKLLPYTLVAMILICGYITPISGEVWQAWLSKGIKPDKLLLISPLLLLGLPFLLLGALIFLYENTQIGIYFLLACIGLVFYCYYHQVAIYAPHEQQIFFLALIGVVIFALLWFFRAQLTILPWIRTLSDMTYSVYLFHNWFFEVVKNYILKFKYGNFLPDLQALIILFIVCFCAMTYIEKPGIRAGQFTLSKLRKYSTLN